MDFGTLGNIGSWFTNGSNLANAGKALGGIGSLYGAYNANKLGNKQIGLMDQQNKLMLDSYEDQKKDKAAINNSFSSVWG